MKLRNLLATAGVTVVTAAALAPAASAQTGIDFGLGENLIKAADCNLVEDALSLGGFVDEDTTRNELASELRSLDSGLELGFLGLTVQSQYAGVVADKALDCGIVKEDPAGPFAASSEFLESLGLPGIPAELQNLSSF